MGTLDSGMGRISVPLTGYTKNPPRKRQCVVLGEVALVLLVASIALPGIQDSVDSVQADDAWRTTASSTLRLDADAAVGISPVCSGNSDSDQYRPTNDGDTALDTRAETGHHRGREKENLWWPFIDWRSKFQIQHILSRSSVNDGRRRRCSRGDPRDSEGTDDAVDRTKDRGSQPDHEKGASKGPLFQGIVARCIDTQVIPAHRRQHRAKQPTTKARPAENTLKTPTTATRESSAGHPIPLSISLDRRETTLLADVALNGRGRDGQVSRTPRGLWVVSTGLEGGQAGRCTERVMRWQGMWVAKAKALRPAPVKTPSELSMSVLDDDGPLCETFSSDQGSGGGSQEIPEARGDLGGHSSPC